MDGATLQGKIYYGYAQSALRIGLPFNLYRPVSATQATVPGTLVQSILASFNAQDMKYGKPSGYGKPSWYCLADGRLLDVGDYLVGAPGTFFIAAMQPLLPIIAIACNHVVTVYRPQHISGVGAAGYGGNTAANETPVVTGYPASVLQGGKGSNSEVDLPGDTRAALWQVLLPPIPGAPLILTNDIVIDENGRRLAVSSAEQSDMGWRITAIEYGT